MSIADEWEAQLLEARKRKAELEKILLTTDGAGKVKKAEALHEYVVVFNELFLMEIVQSGE
jgi:hypothetical protein